MFRCFAQRFANLMEPLQGTRALLVVEIGVRDHCCCVNRLNWLWPFANKSWLLVMSLKRARKPFEVRTSSEKKTCPTKKTHRFLPKKPLASPHCPSPSSSSTWSPQAAPMTVNESFGAKWIHITRGCPGKKVADLWQNTVSKLWKQRVMRYLYLLVHKDVKNP